MKRRLILTISLLLPATIAFADGDGPTRKMNGAEAAAYNAVEAGVRDALPKNLPNYTVEFGGSGSTEFEIPQAIKADGMVRMVFKADYKLSQEVRDQQLHASYMDRAKGTPEQQAQIATLEAKEAELKRARDKASGSQKDRIRAEIKAVQAEAGKIQDQIMADYQSWAMSGGAMAAAQNADRALPPKELSVRALVNQDLSLSDQAAPYRLEGFPLAFEQSEGCERVDQRCVTVLIGPFDKEKRVSGYTRYNLRNTNLGVATKPRGIALVVSGPKDKPQAVHDFLARIDLAGLRGLLH